MKIKSILFYNFRNFKEEYCELGDGFNLILGENGAGKTTFLEGLNMALTGSCFSSSYEGILRRGERAGGVKGEVTEGIRSIEKIVYLNEKGVRREINNKSVFRMRQFKTHNTIIFEPYDTMIIDGGPELRRRFIDNIIFEVSASYEKNLRDYRKILMMRNAYLKEGHSKLSFIIQLDDELIRLNRAINEERIKYLELIQKRAIRHLYDIERDWSLQLNLKNSWRTENTETFRDEMLKRDFFTMRTSWGVHKDDIDIIFNSSSAKCSASRGQKRAVVVSLKLANLDIYERLSNNDTILLFDDLLYEFDPTRNKRVAEKISGFTAFVTSTTRFDADHVINIKDNKIIY